MPPPKDSTVTFNFSFSPSFNGNDAIAGSSQAFVYHTLSPYFTSTTKMYLFIIFVFL